MSDERKQRTYVPKSKAKVVETQFGTIIKLGFNADVLINFVRENTNAAGYFNMDIVPRRQTDEYGNSHSCVLNDWKPDPNAPKKEPYQKQAGGGSAKHSLPPENDGPPESGDVPF